MHSVESDDILCRANANAEQNDEQISENVKELVSSDVRTSFTSDIDDILKEVQKQIVCGYNFTDYYWEALSKY